MSFRPQPTQTTEGVEGAAWDTRLAASLHLSWHHKSMCGHLDVRAVWRLLLTSTKGPLNEGVAMLTECSAFSTVCFIFLLFLSNHSLCCSLSSFNTRRPPTCPCNYTCSAELSLRCGWAKPLVNKMKSAESVRRSATHGQSLWKH